MEDQTMVLCSTIKSIKTVKPFFYFQR